MLRQPLMLLPRALAGISDGRNAFDRLQRVFEAPIREGAAFAVDPTQEAALVVEGATFEWEETLAEKERREAQATKKGKKGKRAEPKEKPAEEKQRAEEKPFMVDNVSFSVRKGELVAIVGPVGCGKSSLLQGLIGEMRKVRPLSRHRRELN
jgi:ATP-binding cassette subfamily C (CFTR/MRP) protein 1